jgi:hypothetical protein
VISDAFFLAYGGLHWAYADILALPLSTRKKFVALLERQIELEKEELSKTRG